MNYRTKLLLDEALNSSYLEERVKLAFKAVPVEPSSYSKMVDSIVRMPGPLETPRKVVKWLSPAPTEVSKSFAGNQLHASGEVANEVKPKKIQGIS